MHDDGQKDPPLHDGSRSWAKRPNQAAEVGQNAPTMQPKLGKTPQPFSRSWTKRPNYSAEAGQNAPAMQLELGKKPQPCSQRWAKRPMQPSWAKSPNHAVEVGQKAPTMRHVDDRGDRGRLSRRTWGGTVVVALPYRVSSLCLHDRVCESDHEGL